MPSYNTQQWSQQFTIAILMFRVSNQTWSLRRDNKVVTWDYGSVKDVIRLRILSPKIKHETEQNDQKQLIPRAQDIDQNN